MRRIIRWVVASLAIMGFGFLSLLAAGIWLAMHMSASRGEASLPDQMVLTLDLEAPFHEAAHADPLAQLTGQPAYSVISVVSALDRAARDPKVRGLFATLGESPLGMAQIQEIRAAVQRFRTSGKPAILFAETIGEGGHGSAAYYLATAFDRIWLQPSGEVGLTGYAVESPFLRGTLDLLGIQPQFAGRKEYKTAIETFTDSRFSAANAETIDGLLDAWTRQTVQGMADGRRMGMDKALALFGRGPFLSNEALTAGLVDQLGYRNDAWDDLERHAAGDEVDVADYAAHSARSKGSKVALIVGSGAIQRGEADGPFGPDESVFAASTIAQAVRDAVDDPDIQAILFRIDSPGGSYVASDTVWNEVRRARQAGKPVVVSMGNMAASGGYFAAMAADRIIAQPGTITGSIGVFSGKMVLADFWKKLGVSWDERHRGPHATLWSSNKEFSPAGWERLNAVLDFIYDDFTRKAAEGRAMPQEQLEKLARGRVWSGADAKRLGLVDELGGYDVALSHLRQLLRQDEQQPLHLVAFPEPPKPWEMLARAMAGNGQDMRVLARTAQALAPLQAALPLLTNRAELLSAPSLPKAPR